MEPLVRLIALMPGLRVVLLQGRDAQSVWRHLARSHTDLVRGRNLAVVETYHPGPQALWSPDPAIRQQRQQHRIDAYRRAAALLATDQGSSPR